MSECTLWTGSISEDGYGRLGSGLAHRRAWEDEYGPIPLGMTIDHTCHDPDVCKLGRRCPHRRCVNVEHMELVTADENRRRGGHYEATHCRARNHEYTPENTLICRGARYCRTCRREAQRDRQQAIKLARCAAAGHDRQLVLDRAGREYCSVCREAQAKANGDRFRGTGRGRDPVLLAASNERRYARSMERSCRRKGHERKARQYGTTMRCEICMASVGRPRRAAS